MAAALVSAGARRVYCTDIHGSQDETLDFVSGHRPKLDRFDAIITNPPYGKRNKLAAAFVTCGLQAIGARALLALLLPADFDSALTRRSLFADCPDFRGKIVLLKRIVWFARSDGKREGPKENHAWFIWSRGQTGMIPDWSQPVIRYAPLRGAMQPDLLLAADLGGTDLMRSTLEQVADLDPPNWGRRASRMDSAWDCVGVGTKDFWVT
jgi:hypothetical protein